MPGCLGSWWGPYSLFTDDHCLVSSAGRDRERGKQAVSYRRALMIMRAPPSWPNPSPPSPHPEGIVAAPATIPMGIRVSTYELWGDTNIQSKAPCISFPCLLSWLGLPTRCWKQMGRGDILALFLILVGKYLVSLHLSVMLALGFSS